MVPPLPPLPPPLLLLGLLKAVRLPGCCGRDCVIIGAFAGEGARSGMYTQVQPLGRFVTESRIACFTGGSWAWRS